METVNEKGPRGQEITYEFRVSPSGIITKVPIGITFNKRRAINPIQRSNFRAIMGNNTRREKPTEKSRRFAATKFGTVGGRGKVAVPFMTMSKPYGGGRGRPATSQVTLRDIINQEKEMKLQGKQEMMSEAEMFRNFLVENGISPTSISKLKSLSDLASKARSTVMKKMGRSGGSASPQKGNEISGQEKDINRSYNETLSKTGNVNLAENAAERRKMLLNMLQLLV
jgi:hypothetical protein